jgi:hypothetical protein
VLPKCSRGSKQLRNQLVYTKERRWGPGYDFDGRLSQNEIHEVGRLAPSIVNSDSCPADQFYTIDPEREPIQFYRGEALSAEHVARRLGLQSSSKEGRYRTDSIVRRSSNSENEVNVATGIDSAD